MAASAESPLTVPRTSLSEKPLSKALWHQLGREGLEWHTGLKIVCTAPSSLHRARLPLVHIQPLFATYSSSTIYRGTIQINPPLPSTCRVAQQPRTHRAFFWLTASKAMITSSPLRWPSKPTPLRLAFWFPASLSKRPSLYTINRGESIGLGSV